ncbi:hypothetical protein PFISCL1PPCAC_20745, partial [Pristionchus fissidentatus]
PAMVKQVNQTDLSLLLDSPSPLVIEFFAAWCGPCKMMAPKFEKLAIEFPNVNCVKVDIDEQEALASKYEVNMMPTFVFFKDGKEIHRIEGTKEENLRTQFSLLQ